MLTEEIDEQGPSHAVSCGVFVERVLSFANSHAIPIDAVAVSMGPGSYTGLRIGVSMAKGVCYGYNIPLVGVSTLALQCVPVLLRHDDLPEDAVLVSMIDARRMEVYATIYNRALKELRPAQADIVNEETYQEWLDRGPVYFLGDGADKCQSVITHPNAHFLTGIKPLAKYMFPLAERKLMQGDVEDVAYCEPFYLKEFEAKISKNPLDSIVR